MVPVQEEDEEKNYSLDVIQELKKNIYEFEVLNWYVMDKKTTLKRRNEELLNTLEEWKRHENKWKFHASHCKSHLRKVFKCLRKSHIKKLKNREVGNQYSDLEVKEGFQFCFLQRLVVVWEHTIRWGWGYVGHHDYRFLTLSFP